MAYSEFDLKRALEAFALVEERDTDLFSLVEPRELGPILRDWLAEFTPLALGLNSEKARSEFLILPVLIEAKRQAGYPVNILPGVALDVDRESGLTGFCDYLISRSPEYYFLQGPIVAVVEAKREDIIGGLGQCVAEMVAIRRFNEKDKKPTPIVFGCVTTGTNWRFLKLEESTVTIDKVEYSLTTPSKVLGVLVHIAAG